MSDIYLTPAAAAVVSPHGWRQLPSGRWVTAIPLIDERTLGAGSADTLFAHLDYEQLLLVAARYGARPISPEGVVELNAHGYRLNPVTIAPDSSTRAACVSHDRRVWVQLLDWDGVLPVANAGKPWVDGAHEGKSRLFGWSRSATSHSLAPDAYGEWLQPLQHAHNRQHVDYSSLCTLERDTAPEDAPHDTDPAPAPTAPPDLAAAHLAKALGELGVHETPGPASTARIDEYLAVALRGGKPLGLRGDDQFSWCACFASWCGLPPGMTPRAAVVELVADAKGLGLWRDNAVWHDPQPGDLAIYATGGVPHHVNRVELAPWGGHFGAVGGNEANAVRRSTRALTEPVGWITYPRV